MAELSATSAGRQKGNGRLVKKSTRVDLTPMVDLGFLLITFFVFTTALSKPKVMDIRVPVDSNDPSVVCNSCALTLILQDSNRISYYEGMPEDDPAIRELSFSGSGLRELLQQKKETVKKIKGTSDDMVLIIKPASASSYKNFIDILDEVAISRVPHYFIDDISRADEVLLAKRDIR